MRKAAFSSFFKPKPAVNVEETKTNIEPRRSSNSMPANDELINETRVTEIVSSTNESLDEELSDNDQDFYMPFSVNDEDIESEDGSEENYDIDDTVSVISTASTLSNTSALSNVSRTSTITTRKTDLALQMQSAEIKVDELDNFNCNKANRCCLGGNCTRKLTIASVAHARNEFWGEDAAKLCTKDRGEKIFNLLSNAKNIDEHQNTVFKFELRNPLAKSAKDNFYVCEGKSAQILFYNCDSYFTFK